MRRATALGPSDGAPVDVLTLTYDDRFRRRGVLACDGGLELLIDLAEARELAPGAALLLEGGGAVELRAAEEPLAEARAEGAALARLAWHVGNRHTPCAVEEDRLLIRRDPVLEDMLRRLGARIAHVEAPFRPEGGAYGHGRTHGHAHGHGPHDDPDAHLRDA